MPHPSDVLIGLHAQTSGVRAAAFDRDGRQLGIAGVPVVVARLPDGGVEQDMTESWQAAARAVRLLAQQVPDLARRTTALAITGEAGGTWLVDEDGDPVSPALLAEDTRAAPLVEAWRTSGIGRAVAEMTGTGLESSLQSAQLAWLKRERPQALEAAAIALHAKGWLYFCCTGEQATDPADAIAAFGDLGRGRYQEAVLHLLGIEEVVSLLPEILDGSRDQGSLLPAASAALGLWENTPVVLAPPDNVASLLAAGLHTSGSLCGGSSLGASAGHLRWRADLAGRAPGLAQAGSTVPIASGAGFCQSVSCAAGAPGIDWVTGLCQQLLADAGLIGISGDELALMLEQRAHRAAPGRLRFDPFAAAPDARDRTNGGGRGRLIGLSDSTCLYDLMRATYEAQGYAARSAYAALGVKPAEVRLIGEGAGRPALRKIVGACVGAPTRRLRRDDAAAAGAAWFAAVSLGAYADMTEGTADWVEPHLDEPESPDPELCPVYERLCQPGEERRHAYAEA